jgi:hypothetical protein
MSDFWEMFRRIENDLWCVAARVYPDYPISGKQYDGWVLCPRAHATAHLRCIIELTPEAYPGLPGMLWLAKQQFAQVNRFHDGDDLVFAVGDVQ